MLTYSTGVKVAWDWFLSAREREIAPLRLRMKLTDINHLSLCLWTHEAALKVEIRKPDLKPDNAQGGYTVKR